ncbi:YceI family protein [Algibacter sp. AS12]|uniref:YceI family protein n=1 Tax=Algibacter sp. AS12 TaxID=3135773 RepID=UPI00398B69D0
MKHFPSLILLLAFNVIFAQDKLITRTAKASFFSETPVENIYAENNQVASILLLPKKTVAFNVLLKSFKFEKALMEEHFNEKYVHSEKYPAAKFKGTFNEDIDLTEAKTYANVEIKGQMIFHGVTKPLNTIAEIIVNEDKTVTLKSKFPINLEAYNIEVPALVKDKIAPEIEVIIDATYK